MCPPTATTAVSGSHRGPPDLQGERHGGTGRPTAAPAGQEQPVLSSPAGFGQGQMHREPPRLGDVVVCRQRERFSAGFVGQAVSLGCPKRKGELVGLRQENMRAGADRTFPAAILSAKLQPGSSAGLGLVLPLAGCPQGRAEAGMPGGEVGSGGCKEGR